MSAKSLLKAVYESFDDIRLALQKPRTTKRGSIDAIIKL